MGRDQSLMMLRHLELLVYYSREKEAVYRIGATEIYNWVLSYSWAGEDFVGATKEWPQGDMK